MSTLRDKVAVVTGAGSGIGRALSLGLARRGARLAISDVDEDTLAETGEMTRGAGATVHLAPLDVSDRASVAGYARSVADHYGVVHHLYNNAGIAGDARPLIETDYEIFERVLSVNLWGVIYGSREFLPHLIASGDGHLVNISSLNGFMGQANMSAYCTSKFGVRGFTEALRAEMRAARHPVRVTVVHPGGVKTNISSAALAAAGDLTLDERARAERRTQVYNEKLFRTTAEQAAKVVLDGVEKGRERILVGPDAKAVDLGVRLVPAAYSRFVAWWERRMFGDPQ
ncbi:SDR family NAD(P)-dependent oxidoreductase [Rubrivirga sp.]|uniref:SDR family NAD(P)-dependent oxidoreductase n=1 Tax=Rubrivirga sp. TaxID=1885344 RepID=UPI003C75154B